VKRFIVETPVKKGEFSGEIGARWKSRGERCGGAFLFLSSIMPIVVRLKAWRAGAPLAILSHFPAFLDLESYAITPCTDCLWIAL
jgi:hypothetical protein